MQRQRKKRGGKLGGKGGDLDGLPEWRNMSMRFSEKRGRGEKVSNGSHDRKMNQGKNKKTSARARRGA